jgi:hypothetical protein
MSNKDIAVIVSPKVSETKNYPLKKEEYPVIT